MARGFESKSVAEQQQPDFHVPEPREDGEAHELARQRRGLELALAEVRARLKAASTDAHRALLERSLGALEQQLRALGPPRA